MAGQNALMFEVGIKEVKEKIDDIRARFDAFEQKYGKNGEGLTVKLNLQGAVSEAEALIGALKNIGGAASLKPYEDELGKVKQQMEQVQTAAKGAGDASAKSAKEQEESVANLSTKYATLIQKIENWQANLSKLLYTGGNSRFLDSQIQEAISRYDMLRKAAVLSLESGGSKESLQELRSVMSLLGQTYANVNKEAKALAATEQKEAAKSAQQQAKAELENAESMRKAGREADNLYTKLKKLEIKGVRDNGVAAKVDVTALDAAIARMERYQNILSYIYEKGGHDASRITGSVGYRQASNDLSVQVENVKRLTQEQKEAAKGAQQLSSEEQRLAQALSHGTSEMGRQSQVLSDLKSMAMQYLSVWGVQNFLSNIIEIGGQLEKQRLSIGAILGDTAHANELFEKIKNLAVKSPFGVVELDQYTKQLSAYGFKYNELYDMTKRLADISAGAGTDVSRLALALGHVRSEDALSGYTLRQFAMNNIPMVTELAKKLSQEEGRVVTSADVRKRVSNKEIGYEDVIDVIKKMTDESGRFYNMQETISQSVASKFKNLRDSLDIMYGEMAESPIGDMLKGFADALTDLTREWKSFIPLVGSAGLALATYKLSMMAVNATMGTNTAAIYKNAIAYKEQRAQQLSHESMVRALTAEESALTNTRDRLTATNIKALLSTNAISKADALKLVALRKLSLEESKALVRMGAFTAAEIRMALQGKILGVQLGKTGAAIKLFWSSFSSGVKGVAGAVFTPMNAIFAAVSWAMSAFQRQSDFNEKYEDRIKSIHERTEEAYKNLYDASREFSVGASRSMSDSDINLSLDDMIEKLKEYSMLYNTTINDAFKVDKYGYAIHNLSEQYEILAKGISDATEAQKAFHDMQYIIEHSLEVGDPQNGFWKNFGDIGANLMNKVLGWVGMEVLDKNETARLGTLADVLARYAETVKDANTAESMFLRYKIDIISALKEIGVADAEGMDNKSLIQLIDNMRGNDRGEYSAYKRFFSRLGEDARSSLQSLVNAWEDEGEAYVTAVQRMKKSGQELYDSFVVQWGEDANKWPSYWKEMALMAVDVATKSIQGFSEMSIEKQNEIRNAFLRPFGITVDASEATQQVNNLLVYLQNLVGKKWTISIGVKGTDAFDDLDSSKKAYQDADKKVKEAEKNLERLGFRAGEVPLGASLPAMKLAEGYNNAIAARRAARIIYEAYGGDVSELDKDGNTKEKTGSGDDEAKRLREIAKLYKDAYDWYVKYEKQVGESSALSKVKEQFQPLFDEFNKTWKTDLTLDSIIEYRRNLVGLLDEAMRLYQTPEHKNSYMVDAIKEFRDAISNVDYEELGREMDNYASAVKIQLDSLARAWDTFSSVREATGNIELAVQLSGADYKNGQNRNFADALKEKIQKDFDEAAGGISFDINLSDDEIEDKIKASMPSESEERIKGLVEEYKKWRDLQRDVLKNDISMFASLVGGAKDYGSEVGKINDKLRKRIDAIEELVKLGKLSRSEADKAIRVATVEADAEIWEKSIEYSNLLNNSLAMTRQEVESGINKAVDMLDQKMQSNLITAQEYAEEMVRIRNIQEEWDKNSLFGFNNRFSAGIKGGFDGLINYYKGKINTANKEIARQSQNLRRDPASFDASKWRQASSDRERYSKELKEIESLDNLTADLNALAEALTPVIDLFDKLGMQSLGDILGAGQNALSSAASMGAGTAALFGASAGPWGAAAGAGISLLGFALSSIGADYSDYEDAKKEYENLVGVWDDLIDRKRTYLSENWGTEAANAAKEAMNLISAEIRQTRELAKIRLDSGASIGSHSIRYRMWQGSYDYNGQNWRDVAPQIARQLGRSFNNMDDMLDMTSKQLIWIKENYTGLWAHMDDEFKDHLENIIKYGDDVQDILDDVNEKLNGLSFDALIDSYYNFVTAGENANDVLADDLEGKLKEAIVKGMIENLYRDRINNLLNQSAELGKNSAYIDRSGNIQYHQYGANGEILDKGDVASEYTKEEYELIKQGAETIAQQEKETYEMLKSMYGWTDGSERSSGLSKSISGTTEETSNLMASYINAIRAHTAKIEAFSAEYYPQYLSLLTSGSDNIRNIESNTAAIMSSNNVIMESNAQIYSLLSGLRSNTWKVPIA